ncbi:unnamed protein product [Chrysodeixis includens]|uniref:Uncharacterized protein n=1 Tax=Chrysodeixis includens TaxID=689277 RepID=A0A9N8KXJ6_CHRIL|nr:unnamed protein product [Chrysodeixis includens]
MLPIAYINTYSKHLVIDCIKYFHRKTGNVNYYLSNTSFASRTPKQRLKDMTSIHSFITMQLVNIDILILCTRRPKSLPPTLTPSFWKTIVSAGKSTDLDCDSQSYD